MQQQQLLGKRKGYSSGSGHIKKMQVTRWIRDLIIRYDYIFNLLKLNKTLLYSHIETDNIDYELVEATIIEEGIIQFVIPFCNGVIPNMSLTLFNIDMNPNIPKTKLHALYRHKTNNTHIVYASAICKHVKDDKITDMELVIYHNIGVVPNSGYNSMKIDEFIKTFELVTV
jgi:ribonuclease HII